MPPRPAGDGTGQADGGVPGKSDGATPGEASAPSDSGTDSGTGAGNDAAWCETEWCDGEDNDCDGKVDQSFECVLGSTNFACKTRCGTNGKGACSGDCRLPSVAECVPPVESCNAVDDNCDGAVDEGLYGRQGARDALFSQQVPSATFAQVGLAARPLNGMWAFARAEGSQDGERDIVVMSLEPSGWTFKSEASLATDGATYFAVDGDKQVVALASRVLSGGNRSLRIQLFEADQLALLGTQVVLSLAQAAGDVAPLDVSVISEGGKHHVAVVYRTSEGTPAQYKTALRVSTYTPSVGWSAPSTPVSIGTEPNASAAAIERISCRDEWLLAVADGATFSLKRISFAGSVITTSYAEARSGWIAAFAEGAASCDEGDGEAVLLDTDGFAQRFLIGRLEGSVSPREFSFVTGMSPRHGRLLWHQGKWFYAGSDFQGISDGVQVLKELTFSEGTVSERNLPLANGGGLEPGGLGGTAALSIHLYLGSRSAIAALDDGIVVALPSSFSVRSNLQARLSAASPGTPLTAIAAVYQMGCP